MILVAIIGAVGAIIAGYYQGPLANTQWQERPQVFLSLGSKQLDLPKDVLQTDSIGHYVEVVLWNDGQSNGKVLFQAWGTNATVSLDEGRTWNYQSSRDMTIWANNTKRTYPVYVNPEFDKTIFQVEFNTVDSINNLPPNQEITVFTPTLLIFEKNNGVYKLIDKQ